jgi:hypothetical protein
MVLPAECAEYRFGVGHAEFGLMYFFKPLTDSHALAQHFAMPGIVPSEVCYMTRVTVENNASPPDFQGPARSRGATGFGGGVNNLRLGRARVPLTGLRQSKI